MKFKNDIPVDFAVYELGGTLLCTEVVAVGTGYTIHTYDLTTGRREPGFAVEPAHVQTIYEGRTGQELVVNWREISGCKA